MKRMGAFRRSLNRLVVIVSALPATLWLVVVFCPNQTLVYATSDSAGMTVRSRYGFDVFMAVGSGWPDRKWLNRRSPDAAPGDYLSGPWVGWEVLGFGQEGRRWNGETPIEVHWRGFSLPGAYCLLIVIASRFERIQRIPRYVRALTTRARRQRRFKDWGLRCRQCGYDLRASSERCPECGTPIPKQGLSARRSIASPLRRTN